MVKFEGYADIELADLAEISKLEGIVFLTHWIKEVIGDQFDLEK